MRQELDLASNNDICILYFYVRKFYLLKMSGDHALLSNVITCKLLLNLSLSLLAGMLLLIFNT